MFLFGLTSPVPFNFIIRYALHEQNRRLNGDKGDGRPERQNPLDGLLAAGSVRS